MFKKPGKIILHCVLILGSLVMIFPFLWMVSTSLKGPKSIFVFPPQLIPDPVILANYLNVFIRQPMAAGIMNSLMIAVLNTVGTLLTTSMAAYGFAKLQFRGKNILFLVLLGTMMIPGQVTLIPMYIWFRRIHWIDTYLPLVVPAILCNAYGVFLLRQFMLTIPSSYGEAAKIDGASQPAIYTKIILPMCVPALSTLGLFTFMGNWNNFLTPLIYLNSKEKFTVPLIIMSFQNLYYTDWSLLMAAACVSITPIIVLYIFTQKYFIEGISLTGLKA
jgi:multiple sugar transport system permease protein